MAGSRAHPEQITGKSGDFAHSGATPKQSSGLALFPRPGARIADCVHGFPERGRRLNGCPYRGVGGAFGRRIGLAKKAMQAWHLAKNNRQRHYYFSYTA